MATAKKAKTRGSKKLSASRKSAALPSALATRMRALDRSALKNGILINGIPFPDVIKGSLVVKTATLGSSLNTLLKIPKVTYKPLRLFPKGIPVIDQITIEVDGKIGQ
jgi:hypothetical protein